ncbi:hypothetical protein [Leptospira johnsonii]|uniref:Terminase-like family protein n=1 Tax=Leptospira johnsonii TaxID=1917820 RepID=A0A2P2D7U0_9LEPT|nr:hypothetical protein [Leptospira johnsonii]GBF40696.1 hypothetical protein LPTSP1_37140 [Leptospira johnsonii]
MQAVALRPEVLELTKSEVIPHLWEIGELDFLLNNTQQKLMDFIDAPERGDLIFGECHRKLGKTTTILVKLLKRGLKEKMICNYYAQSQKVCRKFVFPIMDRLCQTAPVHLRPVYRFTDSYYEFPTTGTRIYLIGCDSIKDIENQRGPYSDVNVIDEAGVNDHIIYLLESIISPQQLTATNAVNYILTSTSKMPDHPSFSIAAESDANGDYIKLTLDDNEDLTKAQKEKAIRNAGGIDSINCQREYFCKRLADPEIIILPEWSTSFERKIPRDEFYRFYHKYDAWDWGTKDGTFGIFASYQFGSGVLYCEREYEVYGNEARADKVGDAIKRIQKELGWPNIHKEIGDTDLDIIKFLNRTQNRKFAPVRKMDLESMVQQLRLRIQAGQIIIDPEGCPALIKQVKNGIWREGKRNQEFARVQGFGHFDGIAALIYLNLMVDRHTNPIPENYGISHSTHFIPQNKTESPFVGAMTYARRK